MAKFFAAIDDRLREFIERQHIFFNASACAEGRVNLSPRDGAALRVVDANTVVYLDRTGSGNETAAHLKANGRLTLMFCAFEGPPLILRLYGRGRVVARGTEEYEALLAELFAGTEPLGVRQMVRLAVETVQTSCGYGVPLYEFQAERDQLTRWAEHKGEAGLEAYRREKNAVSIDGLDTGMFVEAGTRV
jgi:hypothetical protein